ncbi:MAG: DinB family protein [Phycisphaeraceae bacterium]|nr:DinB family protein [Phycisphaeraceae bacterium]
MTVVKALLPNELAIQQLNESRQFLETLLETLDERQMLARAGDSGNHALWVMGHIALFDDKFVAGFTGRNSELPTEYAGLFDLGSEPSTNRSDYPDPKEIKEHFDQTRQRTIEWARTLGSEALWEDAPESIARFSPNPISALHTLARHDFFHTGQIATVRAFIGMSPAFS